MEITKFIQELRAVDISNALGKDQTNSTKLKKWAIQKAEHIEQILKHQGVTSIKIVINKKKIKK